MKRTSRHGKCENKNRMRLPLCAYLTYLLVATLMFSSVSFSKFATTSSSEDSARVAIMAMDTTVIISRPLKAAPCGTSEEFTVIVTNQENSQICDVAQEYTLYIENLSGNMNLTFEFVGVSTTTYTDTDGIPHTAVTGSFEAGVEKILTYTVRVRWNAKPQPEHMAFEVDALRIVVLASQVD